MIAVVKDRSIDTSRIVWSKTYPKHSKVYIHYFDGSGLILLCDDNEEAQAIFQRLYQVSFIKE